MKLQIYIIDLPLTNHNYSNSVELSGGLYLAIVTNIIQQGHNILYKARVSASALHMTI